MVEYVRLRRCSQTLAFMQLSMRVYHEASEAPGYYAGGIRAKWWRGDFYTYTIWEDRDAMTDFVRSSPHAEAAARVQEFAGPGSCYVEFVSEDPPDWDDARQRLSSPTGYFSPPLWGDLRGR
ncbi:MAG: hypothetical protein OXE50_03085 [Chloroflexi bacterium]|nr:hypothetical protein [Chloroflexota bacterium]